MSLNSQTELAAGRWEYSKEEALLTDKSTGAEFAAAGYTHLITAHRHTVMDAYDEIGEVEGYAGVRRSFWPPQVRAIS